MANTFFILKTKAKKKHAIARPVLVSLHLLVEFGDFKIHLLSFIILLLLWCFCFFFFCVFFFFFFFFVVVFFFFFFFFFFFVFFCNCCGSIFRSLVCFFFFFLFFFFFCFFCYLFLNKCIQQAHGVHKTSYKCRYNVRCFRHHSEGRFWLGSLF